VYIAEAVGPVEQINTQKMKKNRGRGWRIAGSERCLNINVDTGQASS